MLSKFIAFCILTTSLFSKSHLVDVKFGIADIVVVAGALLLGLAGFWGIKRGLELAELKKADLEYKNNYENNIHFEIEENIAKIEELREEKKAILDEEKVLFSLGSSGCSMGSDEESSKHEELQEEIKRIDDEIDEVYENSSCIDTLKEYAPQTK